MCTGMISFTVGEEKKKKKTKSRCLVNLFIYIGLILAMVK